MFLKWSNNTAEIPYFSKNDMCYIITQSLFNFPSARKWLELQSFPKIEV